MNPMQKKLTLAIIPLLVLAWGIFMLIFFDPFYSGSSDPEFPYLVNGLNCALLKFNRIGLIEHPGTPFHIFCGISILFTYLISGAGGIAHDVFTRPEHYLNGISVFMIMVQVILIFAIGVMGMKRKIPFWQIALLQASCFFSDLLMWLGGRVNPDRFFMITGLIFILIYLKHGYENHSMQKFAIWSGTAMALGLATKFNFLPILFLPLLLIDTNKNRLIYVGSGIVSFFVFISPIIDKFGDYRRFLMQIFEHDGLYGGGESKILNIKKLIEGTFEIFRVNPELLFLIAALFVLVFIAYRNRNNGMKEYLILFAGFLFIIALQIIMVSKHFKNYYVAPTFIMYGFMFFTISLFLSKIIKKNSQLILVCNILPLLFVISSVIKVKGDIAPISEAIKHHDKIRNFVDTSISKSDFWFVEPTWESGPYVENALVYGISYCGHREDYKPLLKAINPNIITYEGNNESVRLWRVAPISLDSVVATQKYIYIYSTPERHASILLQMLKNSANRNELTLLVDTVYSDSETKNDIIRTKATIDASAKRPRDLVPDNDRQTKLQEYIRSIKNTPEWLEIVKKKAILKNIPLDSMIQLDAIYMLETNK